MITVTNNAHCPCEAFKYVNNTNLGKLQIGGKYEDYPERGNFIA